MRVGLVLAAALSLAACASIVGLDGVDGDDTLEAGTSNTGTSGQSTGGTSDGGSSSGSSGATSSSSGDSDASADAASDAAGGPIKCKKQEDCPKDDGDHDSCMHDGTCSDFCVEKDTFPCITSDTCCIGLSCKPKPGGGKIPVFTCQ